MWGRRGLSLPRESPILGMSAKRERDQKVVSLPLSSFLCLSSFLFFVLVSPSLPLFSFSPSPESQRKGQIFIRFLCRRLLGGHGGDHGGDPSGGPGGGHHANWSFGRRKIKPKTPPKGRQETPFLRAIWTLPLGKPTWPRNLEVESNEKWP